MNKQIKALMSLGYSRDKAVRLIRNNNAMNRGAK